MCRSLLEGGRRCPGHGVDHTAHNHRRRLNRARRRLLASWLREQGHLTEAAVVMQSAPSSVDFYMDSFEVPQSVQDEIGAQVAQMASSAKAPGSESGAPAGGARGFRAAAQAFGEIAKAAVLHGSKLKPGVVQSVPRGAKSVSEKHGLPKFLEIFLGDIRKWGFNAADDRGPYADLDPRVLEAWKSGAREWAEKLTSHERSAIEKYTGSGFDEINQHLRQAESEEQARSHPQVRKIDEALAKLPKLEEPVTVYRGVRAPDSWADNPNGWAEKGFPVGATVDVPTYLSTSMDPEVAKSFTTDEEERSGIIWEMRTREGGYIGELSALADAEREHLIPRNTRWRVVGFTPQAESAHNRPTVYLVPDGDVAVAAAEKTAAHAAM